MENRSDKILILDGATGTMLQKYAVCSDGNNDWTNITHPEVIASIHREYIASGADIIETNTFNSNRISQKEYGLSERAAEMAFEGARIARTEADRFHQTGGRRIWVAGSIGPTSKSLSLSPEVNDPSARPYSFDEMAAAYQEQMEALVRGGVDLILLETCFDALNVKAGLYALGRIFPKRDFPVMVSVSVSDRSGRTLTGQTLEAFYTSIRHYPLFSFGLNCSLGAEAMIPLIREVCTFAECAVSCYPNAGLPNELGGYDEQPGKMAADMRVMAAEGLLNIAGGCCGTTPDHIRAIAEALKDCPARRIPEKTDFGTGSRPLTVSGLEPVSMDREKQNFINIGERTNVAGSRKFARLIAAGSYEEALEVAAAQIGNGAAVIDINMDDAMLDSTREMTTFTRYLSNDPNVAKAALMIDSSHWDTLLAGLKNSQGKCIVNSISLKEGEEKFLHQACEIHNLGAAMVVMAFDEDGQATSYERKIQICSRAYRLLTEKAGIPPEDIIFDVNVLSIATGIEAHARYGIDFIDAVRWIKRHLPGALTSGGISNLSFAFRGNNKVREAMHSVFLYHAIRAGLDMGIVNPGMLMIYDDIEPDLLQCIEDVLFNRDSHATERLIAKAQQMAADKTEPTGFGPSGQPDNISGLTASERLRNALIKGTSVHLKEDLMEVLSQEGSAVNVIEGPLMAAMETVGDHFGKGKMFLPQVVKSAKIMKEAVSLLEPYMNGVEEGSKEKKPTIIIATVKGDVHDIGKNITSIVLSCNGFEVIDLGVMVEKEKILDTAVAAAADIIAVSGLITPSLFQMEEICKEMTVRHLDIPLFIGGATTSALHTAVKLAPLYDKVFYGPDASACAVMAKHYLMDPEQFIREEHQKQEQLRALYAQGREQKESAPAPAYPSDSYLRPSEMNRWSIPTHKVLIRELMPDFDWHFFFLICGIRDMESPAALALKEEALQLISEMAEDPELAIMESVQFYESWAEDDVVFMKKIEGTGEGNDSGDSNTSVQTFKIPMLRQEEATTDPEGKKVCLSLADYVPQRRLGITSVCGLFTITAQRGRHEELVGQAILDTFAEAASTRLDREILESISQEAMHRLSESIGRRCEAAPGTESSAPLKIIKPAAGYPCLPDHSVKADILRHLPDPEKLGISLTESYGMHPDAAICGMIFLHPDACYPDIRSVSRKQYEQYRQRRGWDGTQAQMLLGNLLKDEALSSNNDDSEH